LDFFYYQSICYSNSLHNSDDEVPNDKIFLTSSQFRSVLGCR